MSCAVVHVAATLGVFGIVSARLGDINFATPRPVAVDRLLWHHPNGRPQPVAFGHLGNNLNLTIADAFLSLGGQASRSDRRDHGALLGVRSEEARRVRSACARTVATLLVAKIERVVGPHLIRCDGCCLVCQGRHDVQTFCVDIAVPVVGGSPIKGAVTEAIDLDFTSPNVGVESLKVVLVDETELKCLVSENVPNYAATMETHIALTIRPNSEEADDTGTDEAQQDEDANDQIVPSCALHGLVAEPWFLIFSNEPVALEHVLGAACC